MERTAYADRLTIIAIAVIAYAIVNVCHEIIGHCTMAVLVGTKCKVISSTYIPLAPEVSTWKYNLIVVAGCIANFIAALVCLVLLRRWQTAQPTVRYFLWLTMSVNLFLASTYIAVAPVIKFGDSYILIQSLPRQFFWRSAVALVGAVIWWFSFQLCRKELGRLIGFGGREARPFAWKLVAPAYIAGGIITVMSALFSQLEAKWAQLQAAGGTFGLTIWLLLLPFVIPEPTAQILFPGSQLKDPSHSSFAGPVNQPATPAEQSVAPANQPFVLSRSLRWIVAGALVALIFVGVLGRGIPL